MTSMHMQALPACLHARSLQPVTQLVCHFLFFSFFLFSHFTASGRSVNTFKHVLHDLGYILRRSPKPLLLILNVLLSSQLQSTNFEQNLMHFIGFISAVGEESH